MADALPGERLTMGGYTVDVTLAPDGTVPLSIYLGWTTERITLTPAECDTLYAFLGRRKALVQPLPKGG